jgi:hypothetical protein
MIQSEKLCGRAHLFNSLGIPLWEGDLVDGYPELTGSDANVSHRAVDIHTGFAAAVVVAVAVVIAVLVTKSHIFPLLKMWSNHPTLVSLCSRCVRGALHTLSPTALTIAPTSFLHCCPCHCSLRSGACSCRCFINL